MSDLQIDVDMLRQFEKGLDPRFPEKSMIPSRVLGYGEISTVLAIDTDCKSNLAYKRLPMFKTEAEAGAYEALYNEYIQLLQDPIGLQVPRSRVVRLADGRGARVVVYIVQEQLPSASICHHAIHHLSPKDVRELTLAILREIAKVFAFNLEHRGTVEVGLDGQISNWAINGFDPATPQLQEAIELTYFDTSTPFMRRHGEEQLDSELFLRSAPSFLVWILRLFFLEDVMTRYYDARKVMIDLVANFYKEQRSELVPDLVDVINGVFASEIQPNAFKPLGVDEIRAYYREDAWIWRLYLAFRKVDRSLHGLMGKDYPYILPNKIKR